MKKKLTYEEIRKIIIDKCIEQDACVPEFTKLKNAKTESDFWEVIKINYLWSFDNKIISVELFENYDHKKLNDCQIFVSGTNILEAGLAIMMGGTLSDMRGGTLSNMRGGTLSDMRGGTLSNMWGGTLSNMWGGTLSDMRGGTLSDKIKKASGTAVVRCLSTKKIYIKKGEFEIVYFD